MIDYKDLPESVRRQVQEQTGYCEPPEKVDREVNRNVNMKFTHEQSFSWRYIVVAAVVVAIAAVVVGIVLSWHGATSDQISTWYDDNITTYEQWMDKNYEKVEALQG